jgi:hypothetical protein
VSKEGEKGRRKGREKKREGKRGKRGKRLRHLPNHNGLAGAPQAINPGGVGGV